MCQMDGDNIAPLPKKLFGISNDVCQMGFMDYFANDMFEAWDAFGDFPELIENLRSNYTYWQGQQRIRDAANPALLSPSSPSTAIVTTVSTTQAQSASR